MTVEIHTLAERPDLIRPMWDMPNDWPEFMLHDPTIYFGRLPDTFPEYQLVAVDGGRLIGKVNAIPFVWDGTDDDLPERGWEAVMERGFADHRRGRSPTAVSLLEARVVTDRQGTGFSTVLLQAALDNMARFGLTDLFGSVRPTRKHLSPDLAMTDYVRRTRPDGLPEDPWLRTHVRMGARIVKVCPLAMTIPGTLASWREWTGLPFDISGPVYVEGGLNPVLCDVAHDHAVYIEANVWMHHRAGSP